MTTRAPFSAWQPVRQNIGDNRPAQVLGGWYGQACVADILGAAKEKKMQVTEVNIGSSSSEEEHMVGYFVYHDSKLAQFVLLNEEYYTRVPRKKRPAQNVQLRAVSGQQGKLHRLTGDSSVELHNISWAALVPDSNGTLHVDVKATETVLLKFD